MNYLAEILAFSEWKEVNPLPASAIALWYELMAICNKAGWIQEFTVPNGLLQAKCGLSRKEFDHARSLLINFGRIKYRKSERVNQAGKYTIISFVQKGQQEGQQKGQQEGQREEHTGDNARGTLYKLKLNKTKLKDDDDTRARESLLLLKQIEAKYRPVSSADIQFFTRWQEEFPDDVILDCVRRAFENGAYSHKYMDTIFQNWMQAGVKTIEDVYRLDEAWEKRKANPKIKEPEYPPAQKAWEEVVDKLIVKKQKGIVWSHDFVARAVKNVGYLRIINTANYNALMPVFIAEYNAIVGGG